ncbi:MAG: c-type cytochrome [Opitutus sp.]|nr:c-type cytochrome [Opitutus sp.]
MTFCIRFALLIALGRIAIFAAEPTTPFDLRTGDRVVLLGDRMIEGEQYQGWVELMLTSRFADRAITFRNLGWSGDTPAGDSRFGFSLLQAGKESADEGWKGLVKQLEDAKPTVVFVGYGMASSFDGAAGVAKFKADYHRVLDTIERVSPGARLVLLSPLPHENLGAPWPDAAAHNAQLALYAKTVGEIATARRARFISLFDLLPARSPAGAEKLTDNGIQPTPHGYRVIAEVIEDQLFGDTRRGPWRTSLQAEPLRQAILRKNEWFFHRSRPANMAYIFGFRKREQGKNAVEVLKFDEFIATEEKRIAQLRALQPANVPEIPRRVGNLITKLTPQPHPAFEVADGLEVTLWAENPLLHKPIQMNFDPRGRLWVASSELYPQIEPGQAATDRIIVLEDTTGAGRADKATVFADGLLIPTGVAPGDGGVYVAQSTELLHFKDTDGDGKADVRRTVLSGFGTEDTHHNLHTLKWGPDGRLYMDQSVYTRTHAETPGGVVRLSAGGIFRFDPRDQKMEILFRGWVNAWGHQFDDYGQSFVTDGAGFMGISWGVPGATYRTLAPARRELQSVSAGNYPKFCGIEIVRSRQFPADWQGDIITADFRAHRIVRFKVSEQASGYVTKEMPDLMRTTADTFRPIDVRLGPDGALYIADWSNPIIQHGEVDFRDTRRDKSHGRIWRVALKGAAPAKKVDFTTLANPVLLDRLLSPSGYDRESAKRVLVERGAAKVLPDLEVWTKKQTTETARLNALWTYQAFNASRPEFLHGLLAAKDGRVRAAAVRALLDDGEIGMLEKLSADSHPRVRVEAVRALGKRKSARAAELALAVLDLPMDRYLDYAVWLTINELAAPWIAAVKSGAWRVAGHEKQLEFALKAIEPALASEILGGLIGRQGVTRDGTGPWIELIGSAGGPAELRGLFGQVLRGDFAEPVALRALAALGDAARLRGDKPSGETGGLAALLGASSEKLRNATMQLAGTWELSEVVPQLLKTAGNPAVAAPERMAAFAALRQIGGRSVVSGLQGLAGGGGLLELRREAAVTLASLELPSAVPHVIAVLKATTDEAQARTLWRALLGIRGVSAKLATELGKTELPREVARAGLRPAREGNQHQALVAVLMKQAGLTLSAVQLTPAELQAMAKEALAKGDAARGEQLYRRTELACVACHAIGGAGGKIGPDLTSIGASAPPDYLVESLLYPSAKIKEGYHSVLIATKDGQEINGMITRETDNEVVLRDAANQEISIPTKNIARRTSVGSLMPAGLVDTLLPEERLDLFKFLSMLGKPGDYDAARGGVARVWKLYVILSSNQHLGSERVVAGDFALNDWQPALSLVSGVLAKETIEATIPNRINNRGLFAATQFESVKGGPVKFTVSGEATGAWVNGKHVKSGKQFTADAKPGVNTVVLQLQLNDVTPGSVRLASDEVTFLLQ